MGMKIHLDTDIGSEMTDATALTLAVLSPEIELISVSTVTGNSLFRRAVAGKFLKLLGIKDIPVAAGYGNSKETHSWEKGIIFPHGFSSSDLETKSVVKLIIDQVNTYRGEIVLVGIGPLTNIAKSLEKDSLLVSRVLRIVLMGGMFDPPEVDGQEIPRGFEYNFCQDSISAEKVLKAGFDLTLVPGDLTFRKDDPWADNELKRLFNINHPVTRLLRKLNNKDLEMRKIHFRRKGIPLSLVKPWINDEVLMTYLIKPDLFTVKEVYLKWRLPDKYPRLIVSSRGFRAKVVCDADFKRVRSFILKRLGEGLTKEVIKSHHGGDKSVKSLLELNKK